MIIIRKILVALTGLFICVFLIAHLGANVLLLLPETQARAYYNAYSLALRESALITGVAYINYACIIFHVAFGIILTVRNRRSKGTQNRVRAETETSSWSSQNMAFLGSILLAFIVIHMANFWYRVKFLGEDQDLYGMVIRLFQNPGYVLLYSVAMLPLALHLAHGVKSAFKSLGLYHIKYLRWVAMIGVFYSWILGVGFAIIPIVLYFRQVRL